LSGGPRASAFIPGEMTGPILNRLPDPFFRLSMLPCEDPRARLLLPGAAQSRARRLIKPQRKNRKGT
jgi:hypothetical protein